MKKINFNEDFNFELKEPQYCFLNEDKLIFLEYFKYDGPVTMQYLPSGGIQSLFGGLLIIKVNNGFLGVKKLEFNGQTYDSQKFIKFFGDFKLMNQVLI